MQDIIAMPEFMPVDENGCTEMIAVMVQGVLSVLAIIRQDNETEEVRQVMEVRLHDHNVIYSALERVTAERETKHS